MPKMKPLNVSENFVNSTARKKYSFDNKLMSLFWIISGILMT